MTAAELRALIAGATKGPWGQDAEYPDHDLMGPDDQWIGEIKEGANTALIVALRNNAERFAELLAAEERGGGFRP